MQERTILIVEDEDNLREALKYNLEHSGYQVVTAGRRRVRDWRLPGKATRRW